MKLFLDTNVILDVVLNRQDFCEQAQKILQLGFDGECELFASDVTFTTVSYYARKNRTREQLYEVLQTLREFIEVAPTGRESIDWAISQQWKDFEDAVQYYAALRVGADYIISRNVRDYPYNDVPVVRPNDILAKFNKE